MLFDSLTRSDHPGRVQGVRRFLVPTLSDVVEGIVKKGKQAVVIFMWNGVNFVLMASRTANGQAKKGLTRG